MKKHILQMATIMACTGLVFSTVNTSFAQDAKYSGSKFKAATELRALGNGKSATNSIKATRTAKTTGPVKEDLLQIQDGYVVIDAAANDADGHQLLLQLEKLGLKRGSVYGRVVSGLFPIDKVDQLERVETLHFAAPAYQPMHNVGLTTSQGDASLLADKARAAYGVSGIGSKVGVISDSYGSIAGGPAAGVASGDLPADVEVLADIAGGTDEGRGMAEIVHDVAPGAKIAFHTANLGQAGFASGIGKLADAGCNIVVDDVIYFAEPMFQDGIIAQAVDQVVARNVPYFSAAGNQARQSYQAGFKDSKKSLISNGVNYGIAHDFGNGDITQSVRIPAGGTLRLSFQWSDPFFSVSGGKGAQTDLDLLVLVDGVVKESLSSARDNIGGDPYEFISLSFSAATTIELAIVKYAGPDPQLMKYINFGSSTAVPTEYVTNSSTVFGHANAVGAVAVAASPWYNTPVFNTNITRPVVETFSSQGGTPVFITKEGINTGYDESKIRRKPVVTGPDGGNTTFFGSDTTLDPDAFPNFFGTSAAAPHVAAVAALMQEAARNVLTPADITDKLTSTAQDMDDPFTVGVFDTGFDFRTGYGFVQADKAVLAAGGPCLTDTETPKVLAAGFVLALDNNGTRTIEAADIDYGSSDNCGIASITLDKTTFTCANIGNNEVTLTVTDYRGNVSKQTVTVVVVDKTAPTVLAAGLEVRLMNGRATIEVADIDYGSTDNCGIASMTLDKTAFTCANVGTNKVTLAVTDRSGNVAKQTVDVVVIADATCGTSVALSADKLIDAYPNPVADQATVAFRATQAGNAQVKVFDQMGTLVATLYNGAVESDHVYSVTLNGSALPNGVYNCQLVTNGKVTNKRLVITK